MCGIAGICSTAPIEGAEVLLKMRDTLANRGPDSKGEWWSKDRRVGLAHRRLAILDLSDKAGQPMSDPTGSLMIVFNGEIYNFMEVRAELEGKGRVFSTSSDTEVILGSYAEWGEACLSRFTGAFAFAIHDNRRNTLFLARDRAGEKPLYYALSAGRFAFASELKALMADPTLSKELNPDALDYYLAYGCVGSEMSILKSVRKLRPAHAMTLNLNNMSTRVYRYWELPGNLPDLVKKEDELVFEIESLLTRSVNRQLVADVPVGVLLSGGLDSSIITALAAKASGARIKTFTVSFPGHGAFDEGPYARLVASHFGTEHTELQASDVSCSILPYLARQLDEPLADHSIIPTSMLAQLVRGHVKVALGGDGGDELFGGYQHYNLLQKAERIRRFVPTFVRLAASKAAAWMLPIGAAGRNHYLALGGDSAESLAAVNLYFDARFRRRLLSPLIRAGRAPENSPEKFKSSHSSQGMSVYESAARADFMTTLPEVYLVKSDRSSMLHGLEVRAPFLCHELARFAFWKLPDALRATSSDRKVALKMLARKILPPGFDFNRKQGFTMPLEAWFGGEWGRFMKEVLSETEFFDRSTVAEVVSFQERGYYNASRLFALVMFELWRREHRIV